MPEDPTPARPPYAPVLTDGVVTLRAHRSDDVGPVLEQCTDPEMIRWTMVPTPYTLEDAREFLLRRRREWEAGRSLALAVEHEERFAGTVDLRPDSGGRAEIGYGLHPAARGRGIMGRAVRLMLAWGFEALELEVVHWKAAVGNWASRRTAWSAGFHVQGTVSGLLQAREELAEDGWIASLRRGEAMLPAHAWFDPPVLGPVAGAGSARVVLRPHRPSDAARLAEGSSDPVTRRWLPWLPTPYTELDAQRHLEQVLEDHARGRAIYWAMADPADDRLIGEIAVSGLVGTPDHSPEAGYWTHPDSRGRGLTSAALRLVARHALIDAEEGGLGIHRLGLRAATGNAPSRAVALAAGFRHCGTEREALAMGDGTRGDQALYELLADEIGPPQDPADLPALGWPS